MNDINGHVQFLARITDTPYRGAFGGAIAKCVVVDRGGRRLTPTPVTIKASYKIVPKDQSLHRGDILLVEGEQKEVFFEINGYTHSKIQVEVHSLILEKPAGENFVSFLSNRERFPDIGKVRARRLRDQLGEDVYDIIERGDLAQLTRVLPEGAARQLVAEWKQLGMGQTLMELDRLGIDRVMGRKIVRFALTRQAALAAHARLQSSGAPAETYDLMPLIRKDPFVLLAFEANPMKVFKLARKTFSIPQDSPVWLKGAIEVALVKAVRRKDTAISVRTLKRDVFRVLLDAEKDYGAPIRERIDTARRLAYDAVDQGLNNGSYLFGSDGLFHPLGLYRMEDTLAGRLAAMARGLPESEKVPEAEIDRHIDAFEAQKRAEPDMSDFALTSEQRRAVCVAVNHPLSIICGGAGTGKTTVLECLYYVLERYGIGIYQMALAGLAKERMRKGTGRDAYTIAGFLRNVDLRFITGSHCVVVDEASMLDILLGFRLFGKLPRHSRLVLVGDDAQLEPIGPGLLFHVLARMDALQAVRTTLTRVQRQADSTGIPSIAQMIREGRFPALPEHAKDDEPAFRPYDGKGEGVSFIAIEPDELKSRMQAKVLEVYETLGGPDAAEDVRILCPMRSKTPWSVAQLNEAAQQIYADSNSPLRHYNPAFDQIEQYGLFKNDRVMFTRNDWDRSLFNGALGWIEAVGDPYDEFVTSVKFGDSLFPLKREDLADLALAYAISIHKSQGSQFRRVIIPLTGCWLLDRTLIYTAVTRGVEQVVLIGDIAAARRAVERPPRADSRVIGLGTMLDRLLGGDI